MHCICQTPTLWVEMELLQQGGTSAKLSLDVAILSGYFITIFTVMEWKIRYYILA